MVNASGVRRKLADKIDHARDLPRALRAPLKQALLAVLVAHEEDRHDGDRGEPQPKSFAGLLQFLSHSYRTHWAPPSLALNPEGNFVAVWDLRGQRYSVEFIPNAGANWVGVAKEAEGFARQQGHYDSLDDYEDPPFEIPRAVAR
jgi:hypothetical protein